MVEERRTRGDAHARMMRHSTVVGTVHGRTARCDPA